MLPVNAHNQLVRHSSNRAAIKYGLANYEKGSSLRILSERAHCAGAVQPLRLPLLLRRAFFVLLINYWNGFILASVSTMQEDGTN